MAPIADRFRFAVGRKQVVVAIEMIFECRPTKKPASEAPDSRVRIRRLPGAHGVVPIASTDVLADAENLHQLMTRISVIYASSSIRHHL